MEDNNFLDHFVGADAPEKQDEDLSTSQERASDPYGGLWANSPHTADFMFHGNAAIGIQQTFAPIEGHPNRQGLFNLQNRQMPNNYRSRDINASRGMLPMGQNEGNDGLYGASTMTPSIDQSFRRGHVSNNLFVPNTASAFGNSGLGFTHNPPVHSFTGRMDLAHGRNVHQQSPAITGSSYSPAGFVHNVHQSPDLSQVSALSIGQLPGPALAMTPAQPNMLHSMLPYPRGDVRGVNIEPSNDHKYHHPHEENSFTRPDSGFSHYITPNAHTGRVGFEQTAFTFDKGSLGKHSKPKLKVAHSSRTVLSTKSPTSTPQVGCSPRSESREASQDSDRVNQPSSAPKPADNDEDSEYEDAPPKKTRRTRKVRTKVAIIKVSVTVPNLRMANGEITNLPYVKGAGIREPIPEKNDLGLFFETYEESRDGIATPNWMPPQDDATVPMNDEELRPHVMNLREAMKDMSAYIGRPGSKMKNRWLPADWKEGDEPKEGDVLQNPYYPEMWLERRAWDIAKACQRLHLEGPGFIDCLDPLLLEVSFDYKDLTFAERMDRLVAACRHCKDRVAAMLKLSTGAVFQYLLAPDDLVKASKGNRANNDIRQTRLKESATKRKRGGEK